MTFVLHTNTHTNKYWHLISTGLTRKILFGLFIAPTNTKFNENLSCRSRLVLRPLIAPDPPYTTALSAVCKRGWPHKEAGVSSDKEKWLVLSKMSLSPYLPNSMHQVLPVLLVGVSLTKKMLRCSLNCTVQGLWESSEIRGEQNITNHVRQLRDIIVQNITVQVMFTHSLSYFLTSLLTFLLT
jgi:hypothetical protein